MPQSRGTELANRLNCIAYYSSGKIWPHSTGGSLMGRPPGKATLQQASRGLSCSGFVQCF